LLGRVVRALALGHLVPARPEDRGNHLAPGVVVSAEDDVPREALGNHISHHWYRRVGDKCLLARGDGTLYDEPVKAKGASSSSGYS